VTSLLGWTRLPVRLRVVKRSRVQHQTAGGAISSRSADEYRPRGGHCEEVAIRATRRLLENQFVRFCAVGASGYAINLAVYAALLVVGLHYLAASAIAFLVAAASNYLWNRTWTFGTSDAPVLRQGARAFVVSALSLGANQLFLLVLVAAGAGHLAAQAVAILLATPFSFAANKLWAFAAEPSAGELQPAVARAPRRDS
jgi:putative flippase GtrA